MFSFQDLVVQKPMIQTDYLGKKDRRNPTFLTKYVVVCLTERKLHFCALRLFDTAKKLHFRVGVCHIWCPPERRACCFIRLSSSLPLSVHDDSFPFYKFSVNRWIDVDRRWIFTSAPLSVVLIWPIHSSYYIVNFNIFASCHLSPLL